MMKIMSRSKIALFAVLVAVMMVMSMMAVSAAPVADAGTANAAFSVEYTGTTAEAGVAALDAAMKQVEESGSDVEFVLKSDIVIDPETHTVFTVGTDTTSEGKLIITSELDGDGAPKYGITVSTDSILHIKGNVQFKDVILARVKSGVSYYTGSYIFVTEGKGVFGDPTDTTTYGNIVNPNASDRETNLCVIGPDIEVYSGNYVAVGANNRGTNVAVENPTIIFGGNAITELLAGRGYYTYGNAKVAGKSVLTVKDNAKVTSALSGGHINPSNVELFGDAEVNLEGGTVNGFNFAGYAPNAAAVANYEVDEETNSKYVINLNGGHISGITSMYYMGKKHSVSGLDVTVNYGGTKFTNYVYNGPYQQGTAGGTVVSNCNVTINVGNATFDSAFFGGGFINTTFDEKKDLIVFDIDTTINIGATSGATFKNLVIFGSRMGGSSANKIVYSEHRGNTIINIDSSVEKIVDLGTSCFHGGSYLDAQYASHTGDITLTVNGVKSGVETFKAAAMKCAGSWLRADNTSHTGNVTANYAGNGINTYNGALPVFALHNVNAGLSGVTISGNAVTTLVNNWHIGSPVHGGSFLNSPVTNTGTTKLVLNEVTTYGTQENVQFYGGDAIRFEGENNDSTAKSELVINSWKAITNTNAMFFGGSRIVAAGKTSVNSKLSYATGIQLTRNIYGGSDIRANSGEHAGTSTLVLPEGSWGAGVTAAMFAGSRIVANATQSGDSLATALKDAPLLNASTTTLLDECYLFAGSELAANGAKHSGNSKAIFGAEGKVGYIRADVFGGSKITAAATHSGKSEIVCQYARIQNACNVFGGSYLGVSGAVQSGASALTIVERDSTSTAPAAIFGGSYIAVDGAKHTGSSTFETNKGEMATTNHGAGSYAVAMATDADENDGINGGFAQGSVYYIINGGTLKVTPKIAGVNVNVDGDINLIITGGEIKASLYMLSHNNTYSVSVTGNSIIRIHGGTFTAGNIINGTADTGGVAGKDVVKGTYYTEFVEDGKGEPIVFNYYSKNATTGAEETKVAFEPVGRNNLAANFETSSMYVRFVGNIGYNNAEGNPWLFLNFTSRVAHVPAGKKFMDYTQSTSGSTSNPGNSTAIYYPMNGQAVTVTRVANLGANATLADYALKDADVIKWGNNATTYGALMDYNNFTEYKNNPVYVDAATLGGITTSTTALKFVNGLATASNEVAVSETVEEQLETVKTKYALIGTSIRLENLAMRCRAKIDKAFFEADGITAKDMGGYKIAKIGMLVGTSNTAPYEYGGTNCKDVWVWADGQLYGDVGNGKFAEEADFEGYYLYQAAITGYESGNVLNSARANATVYFRGYIILEDANGVETVVYLDSPVEGAGSVNYGKTLIQATLDAKATSWYETIGIDAKAKIEEIIALGA